MLSDSNKSKDLVNLEDIVQELSEENKIPFEELEEICSLSLEYIKKLTEDEKTLSILIPEIGTMYYSERFGEFHKNRVKKYTEGRRQESKKSMFDFLESRTKEIERNEKERNVKKSFHKRKPLLYKFKNIYKKLFDGKIVRMGATLGYQELWTKFSEIQNKIQNDEKNKLT